MEKGKYHQTVSLKNAVLFTKEAFGENFSVHQCWFSETKLLGAALISQYTKFLSKAIFKGCTLWYVFAIVS